MKSVKEYVEEAMEYNPGELDFSQSLKELTEWDSLAIVTFMALVDSEMGVQLPADELILCENVLDIQNLIDSIR